MLPNVPLPANVRGVSPRRQRRGTPVPRPPGCPGALLPSRGYQESCLHASAESGNFYCVQAVRSKQKGHKEAARQRGGDTDLLAHIQIPRVNCHLLRSTRAREERSRPSGGV